MQALKDRLKALLFRRRASYAEFKRSPCGRRVIADLAGFCRYRTSTYSPEAGVEGMQHLEGRREVFLRILQYGDVSDEEIDRMIEEEYSE